MDVRLGLRLDHHRRPDRYKEESMTNKKQTPGLAEALTDQLNTHDLDGRKLGQPPTAKRVELDQILP
jgi:hypothetical protein